ncbi:MAG: aldo/keto reductase family oxidoreductase [Solirubrobacterales bacterium]|nr:aldo/keto reductase family oxidoreductase [Solirubrobacterales bacterium]
MSVLTMRALDLPSGETIPVLGMGTWHLGEGRHPAEVEIDALRTGLDLGMTLIDTAEMYGGGDSERLVGRAITGRRDDAFLVSKVLPQHATFDGTIAACQASLGRLDTDRLDLYLLHWRGAVPLEDTIRAFEELKRAGSIRHWGVSNFDLTDMTELIDLPGGRAVESDQVLYNLARRGIEWNLLPWCQGNGIPIMAYSPIEQGRLLGHPVLAGIGVRHRAKSAQVALAWVIAHPGVCAIPEAGTPDHVRVNFESLQVVLQEDDVVELDAAFPPPPQPVPLEVL